MSEDSTQLGGQERSASVGHKIAKAMTVVVFFWIFWKFGGFFINLLIARIYGEVAIAKDVYTFIYKWVIFAIIYPSLLKAVVPAFMPLFTERMTNSEEGAWDFANTIINIFLLFDIMLLCLSVVFADKIVATLAPGFSPTTQKVAAKMLKIMFPGIFTMNLCILALALQNAYKVFSYPAAGDATQKIIWAMVILFGAKLLGAKIEVIAYGFLVGCAGQIIVNLFGLRSKLHFYRIRLPLLSGRRLVSELAVLAGFVLLLVVWERYGLVACAPFIRRVNLDPEFVEFTSWLLFSGLYAFFLWWRVRERGSLIARFTALAAPLLLGILFARWRELTTSFFQSFTKPGWFGDLEFAKTIGNLPHVMLGQALAIAMLPYLCELAAEKDWKNFGTVLTGALRLLAFIFIPLTVIVMVLDSAIFQLIYDDGNWPEFEIALGGAGLSLYIWGLLFFAIENALMQSFFSVQKVWIPTLLGIGAAVFHILFMVGLVRWLGFDYPYEIFIVAAVSLPMSRAFKNIILLIATRARVRILPFRPTAIFMVKLIVLTVGVWTAVHFSFGTVKKFTPLDRIKMHRVLLDTFNVEPRGWFSRNAALIAVEHSIAPGDVLTVAAEIEPTRRRGSALPIVTLSVESDGTVNLAHGLSKWQLGVDLQPIDVRDWLLYQLSDYIKSGIRSAQLRPKHVYIHVTKYGESISSQSSHFLGCQYRTSARRSLFVLPPIVPSVDRVLSEFAINKFDKVEFEARILGGPPQSQFTVTLEDGRGHSVSLPFMLSLNATWKTVSLEISDREIGTLRHFRVTDVTPTSSRTPIKKTLLIDNLRFLRDSSQSVLVDDFEGGLALWQVKAQVEQIPNERPGERAMHFAPGRRVEASRDVRGYDLRRVGLLKFKVRSDADAKLNIVLRDAADTEFQLPEVDIPKTERRKSLSVPLAEAKSSEGKRLDATQITTIRFTGESEGTWDLWLDNLELSTVWSLKARLPFEVSKAARVFIPAGIGLITFIILTWLLRIEEGNTIYSWLLEHGLNKVLTKVLRRASS